MFYRGNKVWVLDLVRTRDLIYTHLTIWNKGICYIYMLLWVLVIPPLTISHICYNGASFLNTCTHTNNPDGRLEDWQQHIYTRLRDALCSLVSVTRIDGHPCERQCVKGQPMWCKYNFKVENYFVLSRVRVVYFIFYFMPVAS